MKCPYCIKICSKCGKLLVANEMNFNKDKSKKYGVRPECKKCKSKLAKEYRQKNIEEIKEKDKKRGNDKRKRKREELIHKYDFVKVIESNKTWNNCPFCIKICVKCERLLVANENNFCKDSKGLYGLTCVCKDCRKSYKEQYYKENPEKIFNQNNKRRQLENNQGNGITKEQWYEMMNFFEWRCAYSGEYIGGKKNDDNRTIDHIFPISLGGEHEIWNCVPMLKLYNKSKYNNNMIEWYTQQPFYSEERLNKIYEWIEYAKNKYKK